MKKVLTLSIFLLLSLLPVMTLFSDASSDDEWEDVEVTNNNESTEENNINNNDTDDEPINNNNNNNNNNNEVENNTEEIEEIEEDEIPVEPEEEDTTLLKVILRNDIFEKVRLPYVKINVTLTYSDYATRKKIHKSDENGIINIDYSYNIDELQYITLNITNIKRFEYKEAKLKYPEDIKNNVYVFELYDRYINDSVTNDERAVMNSYTIVMKVFFSGDDINDKEAWKYLLTDEAVIKDTKDKLQDKENLEDLEQYIDNLFYESSKSKLEGIWHTYSSRIMKGVKNYLSWLDSKEFRRNINQIRFFKIKSTDNIYQSYITAGTFSDKELEMLYKKSKGLDVWKRKTGKDIGYMFYDKNIYYNTHIKDKLEEINQNNDGM